MTCRRARSCAQGKFRDPSLKCVPAEERRHIGLDSTGAVTMPDKCASFSGHKWDDMPTCEKLCTNTFKADPFISPQSAATCDNCFVGQAAGSGKDQCKCNLQCATG